MARLALTTIGVLHETFEHPRIKGFIDREGDHPVLAAWWVADDHQPTWREAADRMEKLHANGPTPEAFTFGNAFDANGNRYRADQALIQAKIARNGERAST